MIIDKNRKIYILEIASRSSSSFAAETQHYSNGTDCVSANILWSLKKNFSIKKYLHPKRNNFVSHCYYRHISGKIKNLNIDVLKKKKNIKIIKFTRTTFVGQQVKKINFMNRLFYIIYVSKKKNIRKKTKQILSKINLFT
jgi:cAMP phosphodiesterase